MITFSRLLAVAVLASSTSLLADGGICTAPEFREAFLDGQQGVVIDYTLPTPRLVGMGNQILPCLVEIAEHGGRILGISDCVEGQHGCEGWALTAIRMIGTPEARQYLVGSLDPEKEWYLIRSAIRAAGILREPSARPGLLRLLEHDDPEIRTASLVSLGAIGNRADLERMLDVVEALPNDHMRAAANGFRIMGGARALEPLEKRIRAIEDSETRRWAEQVLADWRLRTAEEDRILTTLRTRSVPELYKTIQGLQIQSEEIRAALFGFLEHEDARTRAESVKALARFNDPSDFDRLLEVTLALPGSYVMIGAQGLEHLNNPRAIAPLERYAANMSSRARQRELVALVERLRRRTQTSQ